MSQPQQNTENAAPWPAISPCPFCGCEARHKRTVRSLWPHRIACSGCGVRTDNYSEGYEAAMIADWNRRTPPRTSPRMTREEARRIKFAEVYGVTGQ